MKLFTHGKKWAWPEFVRSHHFRTDRRPRVSESARKATSERMKKNNPMKKKETREKVSKTLTGRKQDRHEEWQKNQSEAARNRMLTDNPMKDPETAASVWEKTKKRLMGSEMSIPEEAFQRWTKGMRLRFVGNRKLWIGKDPRRCPDFALKKDRVCFEITQDFGWKGRRSLRDYASDRIQHYEANGWKCLVVYFGRPTPKDPPSGLTEAIGSFLKDPTSGAWRGGKFVPFEEFKDDSESTT